MQTSGINLFSRSDVERIVREVLAELTKTGSWTEPASAADAELVITHKVVSLADVEKQLQGIARVVVVRGAVITPAARDELKKYNVTIASAVTGRQ